ncbi:hypothetical protein [Flavobacterium sp.]|jgi:hypothetical protein|uniref:hypothetical protein n=1 Tax=Flavobacterium sp. TaxID=239 RepID=UPI0037C18200
MKVKEAFDELLKGVKFDAGLYRKVLHNNIEFITRTHEHTQLFAGRQIGCYFLKYTMFDKNIFYNNLFDLEYDDVVDTVDQITSINPNFEIARDDINLICFYIAHRFLSNEELKEENRLEYAREVLNYFSYRTLVLRTARYFQYPISTEKAISLTERLSKKYVIKNVRNWNEYCQYRSTEYLKSKFLDVLLKFNDDTLLPNAINDLYNRTNDTLKNIYSEFDVMMSTDNIIKSKSSVITDSEGSDVIADRVENIDKYITRIDNLLVDKSYLVRKDCIQVVVDILDSLSQKQVEEYLEMLLAYSIRDRSSHDKVKSHFNNILINAVDYLQKNNVYLGKNVSVLEVMNKLVGNVLYARGTDVDVHKVKEEGEELAKLVYKTQKRNISDRNLKNIRNALYLYIVLVILVA